MNVLVTGGERTGTRDGLRFGAGGSDGRRRLQDERIVAVDFERWLQEDQQR